MFKHSYYPKKKRGKKGKEGGLTHDNNNEINIHKDIQNDVNKYGKIDNFDYLYKSFRGNKIGRS